MLLTMLQAVLWVGLALSLTAFLCAVYSGFWTLQAVMCPTHLDRRFVELLRPLRHWQASPNFLRVWSRLRYRLLGVTIGSAAAMAFMGNWYEYLKRLPIRSELVLQGVLTLVLLGLEMRIAREVAKTKDSPTTMERIAIARAEVEGT